MRGLWRIGTMASVRAVAQVDAELPDLELAH